MNSSLIAAVALVASAGIFTAAWMQRADGLQGPPVLPGRMPSAKTSPATVARPSSQIFKGYINHVDLKTRTLSAGEGNEPMAFRWDEQATIIEVGHRVRSSALVHGASVMIEYSQREGQRWAQTITILPATRPMTGH